MNNNKKFSVRLRIQSVICAARGVRLMLATQHNAWLHAAATAAVVAAGFYFRVTTAEWCWLVLAIMVVWMAEALNTALEFLCDVASPEFHPLIGKAKDVAAGGVLIAATGSVFIGFLVFWPYARILWGVKAG